MNLIRVRKRKEINLELVANIHEKSNAVLVMNEQLRPGCMIRDKLILYKNT